MPPEFHFLTISEIVQLSVLFLVALSLFALFKGSSCFTGPHGTNLREKKTGLLAIALTGLLAIALTGLLAIALTALSLT